MRRRLTTIKAFLNETTSMSTGTANNYLKTADKPYATDGYPKQAYLQINNFRKSVLKEFTKIATTEPSNQNISSHKLNEDQIISLFDWLFELKLFKEGLDKIDVFSRFKSLLHEPIEAYKEGGSIEIMYRGIFVDFFYHLNEYINEHESYYSNK